MATEFPTTQDSLSLTRYAAAGRSMGVQISMDYATGQRLKAVGYVTMPLSDVRALIHDLQVLVDTTDDHYPGYTGKETLSMRVRRSLRKVWNRLT